MKNQSLILLILTALLCGCEQAIEYNGPQTEQQLAVSAATEISTDSVFTYVDVNHSFFFLDGSARYTSDNIYTACINDADVQIKADNGTWHRLPLLDNEGRYGIRLKSAATDSIVLKVSHPDYGTAYGCQSVPKPIKAKVKEAKTTDNDIKITLDLDRYTGKEDDIILLSAALPCYAVSTDSRSTTITDEQTGEAYYGDSIRLTVIRTDNHNLTSEDYIFNELQKAHNGTYTSRCLMIKASQLKEATTLSFSCPIESIYKPGDEIEITLQTVNYDTYRYFLSLGEKTLLTSLISFIFDEPDTCYTSDWIVVKYNYDYEDSTGQLEAQEQTMLDRLQKDGYVTDKYTKLFSEPTDTKKEYDNDDLDFDISALLDEAFEDIGLAEKRQVYSCFSGAMGSHVISRTTTTKCTIKP